MILKWSESIPSPARTTALDASSSAEICSPMMTAELARPKTGIERLAMAVLDLRGNSCGETAVDNTPALTRADWCCCSIIVALVLFNKMHLP
ncbi:MAG TPA: hypothetical protein VH328_13460 [Burkholderiaceae bacterium]|nr:hypothetical protein [Burkholderiaceae bacterium]